MVEVYVLDSAVEAVRKPSVDETGPGLDWIRFSTRKSNEMNWWIGDLWSNFNLRIQTLRFLFLGSIVVYRESRNRSISLITHVASDGILSWAYHRLVILDVIGLEKVFDFHFSKSLDKSFFIHQSYLYFLGIVGKEFLSGSSCPFIPFLVVFVIFYMCETSSRKMRSYDEFAPSFRYIGSAERYPDSDSAYESVRRKHFFGRFRVDPFEFHKLGVFPENSLHPTEAGSPLERESMDMTMIPKILVVNGRSRPIIRVVFGEFLTLYRPHDFKKEDNYQRV